MRYALFILLTFTAASLHTVRPDLTSHAFRAMVEVSPW